MGHHHFFPAHTPRPQVLLRALSIVLFGIDEKEAPKLNTSAGTILALQRKHNSKVYVRFVWFSRVFLLSLLI